MLSVLQYMNHPKVQEALKDTAVSHLELAFANKVFSLLNDNFDSFEVNKILLGGTLGLVLTDNAWAKNPLMKVQGDLVFKASITKLKQFITEAFNKDWHLRGIDDKDGPLYQVTDPDVIVQTTMAWYAGERERKSRFFDDEVFNTQGGASTEYTLDLEAPNNGQPILLKANDVAINIDTVRVNMNIAAPSELGKWHGKPSNLFVDSDTLKQMQRGRFVDLEMEDILDPTELSVTIPAKDGGKDKTITTSRKQIHEALTKALDGLISPNLMQGMAKVDGKVQLTVPKFTSVFDKEPSETVILLGDQIGEDWSHEIIRFNTQGAAPTEAKLTEPAKAPNEPKPAPAVAPESAARNLQLPITKERCLHKGNYLCQLCMDGKKLKKNQLRQYLPTKLPDGMPEDWPGLEDTQQFAMSWMCGTCRDGLVKQREAAVKNWRNSLNQPSAENKPKEEKKEEPAKVDKKLTEKQEELLKAAIEAEATKEQAEKHLADTQAGVDAFLKATKTAEAPEYLTKAVDDAKYNLQAAVGVLASIEKQLDELSLPRTTGEKVGPEPNFRALPESPAKVISKGGGKKGKRG